MDIQSLETTPKLSAKFFFLSLGVMVGLIWSVTAFLTLLFDSLNNIFPDALNGLYQYGYQSFAYDSIRSGIASMLIVFPLFILVSYFWNRVSAGTLGKVDSIIRRWMIYLILFLASLIIVIDLVTLVRYFISGEITIRFILKVLGAFIVAGLAGSYYIYELTQEKFGGAIVQKISLGISTLCVIAIIVFGFTVIGSPAKQRMLRFDDRRVQDLQSIQYQVVAYWQKKEKLPEKLGELTSVMSGFTVPVDPESEKGLVYEYIKKEGVSFELCATFSLPIPKGPAGSSYSDKSTMSAIPSDVGGGESWDHGVGRVCYPRTIDQDVYPPFSKQEPVY